MITNCRYGGVWFGSTINNGTFVLISMACLLGAARLLRADGLYYGASGVVTSPEIEKILKSEIEAY